MARLAPPLLASVGALSLFVCVRDLGSLSAALLAVFFYATTPLLIEASFGPFSLVFIFLPMLMRELVLRRGPRAVAVLAFAFAACGGFAVWLAIFSLYAFSFGYGRHRLWEVRRAVALGIVPVAAASWLAASLVPPDLPSAGQASLGVPSLGIGTLFLLVFLESFEDRPRLARFLIVLAGTCFFGYLVGRSFQLEFLVGCALALAVMESIGAQVFAAKGTAVIYRATATVAILAFSLLHGWSAAQAASPSVGYDELAAARGLVDLPAGSVVLSDEAAMELVATVSPARAMLTRETLDRRRWTDLHLLMATTNVSCGIVRRNNVTHVLLTPRVLARYPYALKYSGLPAVSGHQLSDSLKLVEVGAYCSHRA